MLTVTCSVTAKYRERGGCRYVLDPVASHSIVPGVSNPQGIDHERTHVAVYDSDAAVSVLRLNDISPESYKNGGCLIVLASLGWLHLYMFLAKDDPGGLRHDLDASLLEERLLISLSTDGVFAPSERVAFEQWLAGERHHEHLRLSAETIPTFGMVRQK